MILDYSLQIGPKWGNDIWKIKHDIKKNNNKF